MDRWVCGWMVDRQVIGLMDGWMVEGRIIDGWVGG